MSKLSRHPNYGYNAVIYNIQGRIIALENMNATIPEKLANLATKAELKEVETSLRTEIKEVNSKVEAMQTKVEAMQTKVEDIQTKVEDIQTKVEAIQTKVETVKGELNTTIQKEQKELRGWLLGVAGIIITSIGIASGVLGYLLTKKPTVIYVPQTVPEISFKPETNIPKPQTEPSSASQLAEPSMP